MSDGILRKTGSYYVDEIGELQRQLTAAKAEIERLRGRVAEEVVSAIMVAGREFGHKNLTYSGLRMFAEDYAQRLRQQAEAAEKGK